MSGQAEVGGIPLAIPFGLWLFHKAANTHTELGVGQMAAVALPANISHPRTAVVQVLGTCPPLVLVCHLLLSCHKPLQVALLLSPAPSLSEGPRPPRPPLVMAFPAHSSSMGAALCDSSTRPRSQATLPVSPLSWDVLLGDRALGERSHPAQHPQQHTVSLLSSTSSGELSIMTGIN